MIPYITKYMHMEREANEHIHTRKVYVRLCQSLTRQIQSHEPHPGSGSDRTIASVRQVTALVMLYIGRLVTCGIDYSFTP